MRLSEWRKAAPTRDAMGNRVMAVLNPVLHDLGADPDPESWVVWGDDPGLRYAVLAPTPAGLISVAVRLTGPEEGPRVTAKLVRWSKLSVSELSVEAIGGHRIVGVQVEGQVLKGLDQEADRICEFVRGLIAGIDGRAPQAIPVALVQAGPGRVGAAKRIAVSRAAATAVGSKPKAPPRSLAVAKPKAPLKAANPKGLHAVPAARTPSQLALPPGIPASTAPPSALPGPAAATARPKPIAARAATHRPRSHRDQRAGVDAPGAAQAPGAPDAPDKSPAGRKPVEPEPDRSEWIGPHPIEEAPSREPNRPRPWTP